MKSLRNIQIVVFVMLAFIGFGTMDVSAQEMTLEKLKSTLSEQAGFGPDDFAEIEKGKTVVKTLKSDSQREVAVVGLVKIRGANDIVVRAFHRTIEIQEKKTSKEYGAFAKNPSLSDLKGLTIDDGELYDLKGCRVNSCKWNFPAALINKFSTDIDWSSEDYVSPADKMVRQIFLDYVIDFSKNGDSALFEYNDKPAAVNLESEYRSLMSQMLWVDEFAPEFAAFLSSFPDNEPEGILVTYNWSKIKIGLKPVILITQNITYQGPNDDQPMSFVVSKQIYANHYFDSSLAQTAAVTFPTKDGREETYLVFLNRSRAGAFTTALGKLARGIVEGQAESRLETVLKDTRKYTSLAVANRNADESALEMDDAAEGYFSTATYVLLAGLVVIGLLGVWMYFRVRRKGS